MSQSLEEPRRPCLPRHPCLLPALPPKLPPRRSCHKLRAVLKDKGTMNWILKTYFILSVLGAIQPPDYTRRPEEPNAQELLQNVLSFTVPILHQVVRSVPPMLSWTCRTGDHLIQALRRRPCGTSPVERFVRCIRAESKASSQETSRRQLILSEEAWQQTPYVWISGTKSETMKKSLST